MAAPYFPECEIRSVTTNSAQIIWGPDGYPPEVFDYYSFKNVTTGSTVHQYPATNNQYSPTGLQPGTTYQIQITSYYTNGAVPTSYTMHPGSSFTTLPLDVFNISYDISSIGAIMNWTPGTGGTHFRSAIGGSGTRPPAFTTTETSYNWYGLTPSTTYTGLIQSSADGINWTAGVAFTIRTSPPGTLSITQTDASTISATVVVQPNTANSTMSVTPPAYLTPSGPFSGVEPHTVVVGGIASGRSAVVTASGSPLPLTQTVYATPQPPTYPFFYYDGTTGNAHLSWDAPVSGPIDGSPYLILKSDTVADTYPNYVNPYIFTFPPKVSYTIDLGFGQDDTGGSESTTVNIGMSALYILSAAYGAVSWFQSALLGGAVLLFYNQSGSLIHQVSNITSPYKIEKDPSLVSGTTYQLQIIDNGGDAVSQRVDYLYISSGGASSTWFFSP